MDATPKVLIGKANRLELDAIATLRELTNISNMPVIVFIDD